MRRMIATPPRGLTPVIGFSLAVVVAGSLVALALLAQRVSLPGASSAPVSLEQTSSASGQPLVVGGTGDATRDRRSTTKTEGAVEDVQDRVLPMRISRDRSAHQTAAPTQQRTTSDASRPRRTDRQQASTGSSGTAIREEMEVRDTHEDKEPKDKNQGRALGHDKDRGKGHDGEHGHDD